MQSQRAYAIISLLVALVVISSSVGAYYYSQYNQQLSVSGTYAGEVNLLNNKYDSAVSSYNSLVSKYNSTVSQYGDVAAHYNGSVTSFGRLASSYSASVSEFQNLAASYERLLTNENRSLYLLVRAVSVMNTTEPVYQNATRELKGLFASYNNLTLQFQQLVKRYDSLVAGFRQTVQAYQKSNNVTVIEQYPDQVSPLPPSLLGVSVLIDSANGARHWYNNTMIQAGWNLYIVTVVLANGRVDATWYPQYGEHLISGIGGVKNTDARSWFLWTYNRTASWQVTQTGADLIPAINGSVYAWTYCQFDQSYQPTCRP